MRFIHLPLSLIHISCRRLSPCRPIRNETQNARPLLVGRVCVYTEPTALVADTVGPQAAGPCSWACRRLSPCRPIRNETQNARPLLVGRAFVDLEPKATGRRHCRLLEDLGHDAGTNRAAAFADSETQTFFARDRRDQRDLHVDVVPRHDPVSYTHLRPGHVRAHP